MLHLVAIAMRAAWPVLLVVHGVIHLLGFLHWSNLAGVSELGSRTLVALSATGERVFAAGWLLALCVLFLAALLWIARRGAWLAFALAGALLSQCLVVLAWNDAKFGTAANVFILLGVAVAAGRARFARRVDSEIRRMLAHAPVSAGPAIDRTRIRSLPVPVRKWLEASGSLNRDSIRTVRLRQRGELRTSPNAAWMPARAEQYFSIHPPAFIWRVDATMMGFLPVAGRDKYVDGRGHMLIKAASLLNLVDAADEKIDHGSMLRFLGEMIWFPSGALSPSVTWEPIDTTHARATMRHEGTTARAVFTFSERGRVLGIRAERYLGGGADARLTPWRASFSHWRKFQGVEVPNRGDVGWELESGYFSYYRWEILDVEFNRTDLYRAKAEPRGSRKDVASWSTLSPSQRAS